MIFFILLICASKVDAEVVQESSHGFDYYLCVPDDYDSSKSYPLIVAFHWSTGRGSDMVERWQEQSEKKGYLVACPNSADSQYWDYSEKEDVLRMIKQIGSDYNIDKSRIYLTGFSGGAMFSYYLGLNNPDLFAAIAPFAGPFRALGNDIRLSKKPDEQIPVFIIHGNRDNMVDISESEYAKSKLEKYGYTVKYMELKGEQHNYSKHISWAIANWFEKIKTR